MQYYRDCVSFAKSLDKLGVSERASVNLMGFNSPEWVATFFGSIFHHNIASGAYPTNSPDICRYQAEHSRAEVVVVETIAQLDKYISILPKLPKIKALVIYGETKLSSKYKDSRIFTF